MLAATALRALLVLLSLSQAASFAVSPTLLASPGRLNPLRCPPRVLPQRSQVGSRSLSLSLAPSSRESGDGKKVFTRRDQLAFSLAFVGAEWMGSGREAHAEDVVVRALGPQDAKELEVCSPE
ncbi:hypothetical protein T484DRAFT_2299479 [Baffinella frigidus]|nr:hypothetical protein T484DRAFT_2299479 [Cryptophyta sp. CCMP2293]